MEQVIQFKQIPNKVNVNAKLQHTEGLANHGSDRADLKRNNPPDMARVSSGGI